MAALAMGLRLQRILTSITADTAVYVCCCWQPDADGNEERGHGHRLDTMLRQLPISLMLELRKVVWVSLENANRLYVCGETSGAPNSG